MTSPAPDLELRRRVLKRFGHLLELNNDIGRNASDTNPNPPRRIYYVFDENVFELFIQPFGEKVRSYCANFYDRVWGANARGDWQYSAQAGMIAAEYLFSGKLPLTLPEDPIYITEWHYSELKNRLRELRAQLFQRAADQSSDAEKYAREAQTYLQSDDSLSAKLAHALRRASPQTQADTQRLLETTGNNEAAALRFVYARALAPRLVEDRVVEPLEQLDRVLSEVFTRLRPLSYAFIPQGSRELEELDRLIEDWTDILTKRHSDKSNRGRIHRDAKSIANVHWVALRKLGRDQRIMLVTGDSRLYEAYSSWHNEQPVGEAFLLRRVNQFAPFINPHDTPNDIGGGADDGSALFDSVRQAMDAPLVSFNLAKQEQGRAFLAELLKKSERPEENSLVQLFTHNLPTDWWLTRDETFEQLRDKWREAERLAIGASLPVLERRLERRIAFLSKISSAANSSHAFSIYLSDLLYEIAEKGLRIDLPDAVRVVHNRPVKAKALALARAPLNVRLHIPNTGPAEIPLAAFIDRWIKGDDETIRLLDPEQNPELFTRLDILYAVATALALRAELWPEADRFAENALTASDMLRRKGEAAAEPVWLECLYLSALAKRFLIASISPAGPVRTENVWRDNLEEAIGQLNQAEARHRELGHRQRALRAVSERVAVRLFYVTWKAVSPAETTSQVGFDPPVVMNQVLGIHRDLEMGLRLLAEIGSERAPSVMPLIINAASCAVVIELLRKAGQGMPPLADDLLDRVEAELETVLPRLAALPPVVSVDVHGFLWLVRAREASRAPLLDALDAPGLTLPLDAALARAIRAEIEGPSPGGGQAKKPSARRRKPHKRA